MLALLPVDGLPEIRPGDDLPVLLAKRLRAGASPALANGDVLVVTQKIVSKAENRFVALADVTPSTRAIELARQTNKEAALVELVLRESTDIVRAAPHVLITRHRLGHIMANAGIDASNIGQADAAKVLLLPEDPDASVHPPYTPVPPTACTEDTATAAVRAVASRLTGRRMAR